jgi:hypothetical protein
VLSVCYLCLCVFLHVFHLCLAPRHLRAARIRSARGAGSLPAVHQRLWARSRSLVAWCRALHHVVRIPGMQAVRVSCTCVIFYMNSDTLGTCSPSTTTLPLYSSNRSARESTPSPHPIGTEYQVEITHSHTHSHTHALTHTRTHAHTHIKFPL